MTNSPLSKVYTRLLLSDVCKLTSRDTHGVIGDCFQKKQSPLSSAADHATRLGVASWKRLCRSGVAATDIDAL